MTTTTHSGNLVCENCGAPAFVMQVEKSTVLGMILVILLTLGAILSGFLAFIGFLSMVPFLVLLAMDMIVAITSSRTVHYVKCTRCKTSRAL
jgi:hypothetical protein